MKDGDKPSRGNTPDNRRIKRSTPASRQGGYVGRANAADEGRSGYGSESVRPYLRAQLRLKELMQGPQLGFTPERASGRKDKGNKR